MDPGEKLWNKRERERERQRKIKGEKEKFEAVNYTD